MYFKIGSMIESHTGYEIFLTLNLTWACGNEFQFQRITPRSYVNITICKLIQNSKRQIQ